MDMLQTGHTHEQGVIFSVFVPGFASFASLNLKVVINVFSLSLTNINATFQKLLHSTEFHISEIQSTVLSLRLLFVILVFLATISDLDFSSAVEGYVGSVDPSFLPPLPVTWLYNFTTHFLNQRSLQ